MTAVRNAVWPPLIVVAVAAAYANTFTAPFLFDDEPAILHNPHVRGTRPLSALLSTNRPFYFLTLRANHALHGTSVAGYHAVNLAIHAAACLVLFGIVRRTLRLPRLAERFGRGADPLAAVVALAWGLHPLQTQAVTYVSQRCESLMGLFYLFALYAVLRAATDGPARRWGGIAVAVSLLGMGTKEVMATAPLAVLFFDRVFLAGSFREALRRRGGIYAGLASGWILLGALVFTAGTGNEVSAGFGYEGVTSWAYAGTQPGVVLHYLRLAFWPRPLCLDYAWPVATGATDVLVPLAGLAAVVAIVLIPAGHRPERLFLVAWFLGGLGPSSSFIPIRDLAFEHRMYLPLAVVAAGVVLGGYRLLSRHSGLLAGASPALAAALLLALGGSAFARNRDYRDPLGIWLDTAAKRPDNPRAHHNIGHLLSAAGEDEKALPYLRRAVALDPDYLKGLNNLGSVLGRMGRLDEALPHLERAARLRPDYPVARHNLGNVLDRIGREGEALDQYREAVRLDPDYDDARLALALGLLRRGEAAPALGHFLELLRRGDHAAVAAERTAWILATDPDPAVRDGEEALRLARAASEATGNAHPVMLHTLAVALAETGRFEEALRTARDAAGAAMRSGNVRLAMDVQESIKAFRAGRPRRRNE